ncbi:MAG TPA: RNA-directed DNA polymerase [Chthoniobacterales bacterium]|nr:RNA-directed DNA polymerase [Chthoniobacterales bacterium]
MTENILRDLPIELAIRLVLDSISYSNPLPPWVDSVTINYKKRERIIGNKILKYLNGEKPIAPFQIELPKKAGGKKPWKVPSVNDQIILQAGVSVLAKQASQILDREHALSYRYNSDPNRLQLTESQVSSWKEFQNATEHRRSTRSHILQVDLENAFESIDRVKFFDFLERLAPKHVAVMLLKLMLESISGTDRGLPLINDSVFFLGNAYLHVVDQTIKKSCSDFIRFVDDYRIFGSSTAELEDILSQLSQRLAPLGFAIKQSKVKLGSTEDYFEAQANGRYATTEEEDGYISATAFEDISAPDQLVTLIARAVKSPDDLLTEGFGRLTLGAIRRIRINAKVVNRQNFPRSPLDKFQELLSADEKLIGTGLDLMEKYLKNNDESWRATWLLYTLCDANFVEPKLRQRWKDLLALAAREHAEGLPGVWARTLFPETKAKLSLEEIHELGYLEGGMRCYAPS